MTKKKHLLNALLTSVPFAGSILRTVSKHRNHNCLTILNYHLIVEKEGSFPDWCSLPLPLFTEQMVYLAKHFHVTSLTEGLEQIRTNRPSNKPLAAITFDDGFQNNYSLAFPVLKKLNLPATIFLATSFIDTDDTIWFGKLYTALSDAAPTHFNWNGNTYSIKATKEKSAVFSTLQKQLKKKHHNNLIEDVNAIIKELGGDHLKKIDQTSPYRMLKSQDIKEMLKSKLIDFGAHTSDHAILSHISIEEQYSQISKSVETIKKLTGQKNIAFAYPNGSRDDFSASIISQLKRAKVRYAVTMLPGFNSLDTDPYELKRIGVGGNWQLGLFKFAVHTGITE